MFIVALLAEFINLYLLTYQHSVEHCIIHFVALEVIVEIPHIFIGSLINDRLKQRIFNKTHSLKVTIKGSSLKFSERSCSNKLGRVIYRICRSIYASLFFYFQPFIVVFIYFRFMKGGDFITHH